MSNTQTIFKNIGTSFGNIGTALSGTPAQQQVKQKLSSKKLLPHHVIHPKPAPPFDMNKALGNIDAQVNSLLNIGMETPKKSKKKKGGDFDITKITGW